MSEAGPDRSMWDEKKPESKGRPVILLGLVALIAAGLWAWSDYFGPRKVWRRAIHGSIAKVRDDHWTRLQRDYRIDGLDRDQTIVEVFAALDDPDSETRAQAIASVPSIHCDPLAAIPRLAVMLDDRDVTVRSKAALAIGELIQRNGPGHDEASFALTKALKDPEAKVRLSAVIALGQIVYAGGKSADPLRSGRGDDPALSLVVARLVDDDMVVRVESALVLASSDRGEEAISWLKRYVHDRPLPAPLDYLADRAMLALMVLSIHSDGAAAFLCGELGVDREGYPERPRYALAWAARQTPEARLRVRRLGGEALQAKNPTVRHSAAILLHEIGSGRAALAELIDALADSSVEIRIGAVDALADMGDVDPSIIPALETATRDTSFEVRERAAGALEAIELDGIEMM